MDCQTRMFGRSGEPVLTQKLEQLDTERILLDVVSGWYSRFPRELRLTFRIVGTLF